MGENADRVLTLDEYAQLPDQKDGIDDLIAGRVVVRPFHSAMHGVVCSNVCIVLEDYHRRIGTGSVALRCGFVVARDPATVMSADASIWLGRTRVSLDHGWPTVPPDGVVEVVDLNEPFSAVMRRVRILAGFGVGVLWLVDPVLELVMQYRNSAVRTFERTDTLDGGDVLPGFSCKVADLFA